MESKTYNMCNIEKHIKKLYKKNSECKEFNRTRGLDLYYGNYDEISQQQRINYGKNGEKVFLQKQNNGCMQFEDLVRSYVELKNKLKAVEEILKVTINDSKNKKKIL